MKPFQNLPASPVLPRNRYLLVLTIGLGLTLGSVGCKKEEEPTPGPVPSTTSGLNVSAMEKSFEDSEESVKQSVDKAVDEVQAGNLQRANDMLRELAENAKLTSEQQNAVKDFMARVQSQIKQMGQDVVEGAKQVTDSAVEGAKKAGTEVKEAVVESAVAEGARQVTEGAKEAAEDVKRQAGDALNRLGNRSTGDR